jgi:hypothetical protein
VHAYWSGDWCWRLFETTGSVWAYLLYRRTAAGPLAWLTRLSLN